MYDERRVQDTVLALCISTRTRTSTGGRGKASLEATDGLHERGLIDDPRSTAKSVALTDEGAHLADQLFAEQFGVEDAATD